MAHSKPRLCIFVIAYQAEATLRWVLERIPQAIFDEYDCHVLVVDDASKDRTYEIGVEYQSAHPEMPLTVLRNEYNQGYGGNQKVGYSFAIKEGFDFVAMVHGDGQYAPEELPRLVAPLRSGEADAVFGSRMLSRFGALKGGMPLYKFVGNKILTGAQNALLGTKLSEFHSGYRIYSTAALKRIRFDLNANDFHFDTEIILQLLNARLRILELPIPTYYGDEISRVNGMKYAKDVMVATLRNSAHRAGILHQRRYDPIDAPDSTHNEIKLGYPSSHSYALDAVPPGAKVLEVVRPGLQQPLAPELGPRGAQTDVVEQPPDSTPAFDPAPYQVLLMLDVIEHLHDPEKFIEGVRRKLDFTPRMLVLTTPNVAFFVQRAMLALGQFNYGRAGVLDRTHARLFTFRSTRHLLRDAGFRIRKVKGIPAPFPKVLGNGVLGKTALAVNQALIRISKSLFSYQIYIEAESTPDVDFVLQAAKERSALRTKLAESRATNADAPEKPAARKRKKDA